VLGGGIGLIPLAGWLGIALVAVLAIAAALRAGYVATRLHNEQLSGRAGEPDEAADDQVRADDLAESADAPSRSSAEKAGSSRSNAGQTGPSRRTGAEPTDPWPDAPTVPARSRPNPAPRTRSGMSRPGDRGPGGSARPVDPTRIDDRRADEKWADQARSGSGPDKTRVEPPAGRKRWFGLRKAAAPEQPAAGPAKREPAPTRPETSSDARPDQNRPAEPRPDPALAPPGFHVYRPSSADRPSGNGGGHPADDDR
jgi:hypothetical protein